MTTWVAFLRAINVTGRFVKMSELAAAFHAAGHTDARTYINSGNVVFTSAARSADRLQLALEAALEPRLGFRSEAFLRTAAQVQAIAARAHALRERTGAGGEVNVCFLPAPPAAGQVAAVHALRSAVDDFEVDGREVYWLCLTRQSDSKFSNAVLERRLGLRSTLRRASVLQGLAQQL